MEVGGGEWEAVEEEEEEREVVEECIMAFFFHCVVEKSEVSEVKKVGVKWSSIMKEGK